MNNTTITNIFNSADNNIAYINIQHCQIMTTIAYIILKFKSMIKKPIVAYHAFFTVVTLNVSIFARIKFRDSRIFLKIDFSRVLNFANRHI